MSEFHLDHLCTGECIPIRDALAATEQETARLRLKVEQYARWLDEIVPSTEHDHADLTRLPQSLLTLKAAANTALGQRAAAEQRGRQLEAALRFYADRESIADDDGGERARAALAPLAEGALPLQPARIAFLEKWLLDIAHRGHFGEQARCLAAGCVDARRVVEVRL